MVLLMVLLISQNSQPLKTLNNIFGVLILSFYTVKTLLHLEKATDYAQRYVTVILI